MSYSTPLLWKTNEGTIERLERHHQTHKRYRNEFRMAVYLLLLLLSVGTRSYALKYSSIVSTNNSNATSGNVCAGATRVGIYSFQIVINQNNGGSDATPVLSTVTYTTTGTYTSSDITTGYKLYYSTSATGLATATQIGTTLSVSGPGALTFSSLAKTLATGTHYFWITADISSGISTSHSITNANTLPFGNITFSTTLANGSSGTSLAGNTQTLIPPPAAITGSTTVCINATTTLANTVAGGTWSSSATGIATVGSTSGIVTGAAAGGAIITYSNGCGTAATQAITVNGLPTSFTVSGGGSYCSGGTGVSVDLGGSQSGVNYQLYNGSSTTGVPVSGTGSAITFGAQTAAGTYSVRATNASTSCVAGMSGSAAVSVNALPTTFTVTGGGSYCAGGSGVSIGLGGSQSGVNYQLYNGSSTTGSPIAGTGSSFSFSAQTAAGTYTVLANNTSTSCTSNMTGSASVSINPLPATYTVTGGGNYCTGGTGVAVGLDGSESGTNYQLYNGSSSAGIPVAGTGSAISFGPQTAAGSYTVRATNATTNCVSGMTSSASISINPLPTTYSVSGGGNYCSGGTGVSVGLGGSQSGVNYQLYNGSSTVGSTVSGTGSAITFGAQTAAGTYTVRATNTTTSCVAGMTGSVAVTVNPLPTAFSVTGGGNYCSGGLGVSVGLDGSQSGISYQLYNGSSTVGSPVSGTGGVISFGSQTAAGTYSVQATNATTSCLSDMDGSATVAIDPLPTAFTVTGGGNYCSGGSGVSTGLDGSQTGVNYQLYNGTSASGTPVAGTGSAISFGSQTAAGSYTVRATNATTNCVSDMTSSASVSIDPLPTTFNVTGGGSYCEGGSGVSIGLGGSQSGINYQLYNGSTTMGSSVAGTGSAISFGAQSLAGSYTVLATDATTSCVSGMTGSASVTIDPLPTTFTVTGGGMYCPGGSLVGIGISSSQTGIDYQLYNGSSPAGSAVSGTGSTIAFASQSDAGTYTVVATNTTTSCNSNMTGSAIVIAGSSPSAGTITGSLSVCAGNQVTLNNAAPGGDWNSDNTSVASISVAGVVTGNIAGTATISYAVTNSCGSATATQIVTVNALPDAGSISGTATVCDGNTTTLNTTGTGGDWSSTNTAIATISTDGQVTGATPGTTTISYTISATCGTVAATQIVTVLPNPAAGTISGVSSVCTGNNITLSETATGGTWTSSNTSIATVSANVVNGVTAGDVTISYTVVNSCGSATATHTVTVSASPDAGTISGAATVCAGATTTLSTTGTGGNWTSSNSSVASVDGIGVVSGGTTGMATISYTISGGCGSATATVVVTVNDIPPAGTITGGSAVCEGSAITLGNTAAGGSWSSGDDTIAPVSSGIVTGASAGTTTISYTTSNSCGSDLATHVVTVNAIAGNAGSISGTVSMCVSNVTTLSTSGYGGNWSSGNSGVATVSASGVVSGANAGTATISYTVTGCGAGTATKVVSVNGTPSAGTITGASAVALGLTIALTNPVSGGSWGGSNAKATVSSTGVVSGIALGTVVVSYSVTSACGSNMTTKIVNIVSGIGGNSGTLTMCVGQTTTLTNSTTGGTWSSNNTSIATVDPTSGIVTGITSGVAAISYVTSAGTATSIVTVNATPTAITGMLAICVGKTATLNNAAVGYGIWTSSNSSIAAIGSNTGYITGIAAGTTAITYTLSTGCTGSTIITINANPAVITGAGNICVGSSLSLSNSTPGGLWSSNNTGDATVSASGVATGVNSGIVDIVYTLPTGCKTDAMITVSALPASITGSRTMCAGSTANLTCTTTGGTWSSSDLTVATIGTSGIVSGIAPGTSTISYVTGAGCLSALDVTVNTVPSISGAAAICPGGTVTLSSSPSGGSWGGGNASIASVSSSGIVTGIGAGTSTVTYSLGTGCKAYSVALVNAAPATITGTLKACVGASTNLSNSTGGGSWSSNDVSIANIGATSGVVNGVGAGTTTITYSTGAGCYRTANVTINAAPAAITGNISPVCIGSSFTLSDVTPGLSWSSSNTGVATVASTGVVSGVGAGTSTITYTAASTNCVTVTDVTINPTPGTIGGPSTGCVSSTITLTNAASGGTWTSGNTAIATIDASTGVLTGVATGTVIITYGTGAGCTQTKAITINAGATLSGYPTVCVGLTTTLSGGYGTWSSGNPSIATIVISGGYVTGISAGTAVMTFTSSANCPATYVVTVIPVPAAITGTTTACTGSTVTLSNSSPGGSWSSSNNAGATIGSSTGIVTAVGTGGSIILSYSFGANCRVTTPFTLKPLPAVFGGSSSVCMPSTSTLTNTTAGGTWTSSNASIATVGTTGSSSYCVITGVSAGTADITYTITSTGCARSTVATVTAGPDPGSLTSSTGAFTLRTVSSPTTLTLTPTGATGGTWSSSNPAKATVNTAGVVTAVASGSTTITYTVTGACNNFTTRLISVSSGKAAGMSQTQADLTLYPNPTPGVFTITTAEAGVMTVYAIDGRAIYSFDVTSGSAAYSLKQGVAAGIYTCRFIGNDGSAANIRLVYEP